MTSFCGLSCEAPDQLTMHVFLFAAATAVFCMIGGVATADDDRIYEFRGFVEPEMRAVFDGGVPSWANSSKPDARVNLKLDPNDAITALISTEVDVRYSAGRGLTLLPDVRELWVRVETGDWQIGLGRQLYSWGSLGEFGVVDYTNPQQLPDMAQNWAERKIGVWSLHSDWDFEAGELELYLLPIRAAAGIPVESPWIPDTVDSEAAAFALTSTRAAATSGRTTASLRDTQAAARAYFSLAVADVGLILASLLEQTGTIAPAADTGNPEIVYGRWTVGAVEASMPFAEGFGLGLESAYLASHDDADGNDPFRGNARIHWAGRVKGFLSASLQFEIGAFGEEVLQARAPGEAAAERSIASPFGNPWLNVQDRLGNVALIYRFGDAMHMLSTTWLTSLEGNGHYLNPAAAFRLVDVLILNAGFQIFAGDDEGIGDLQDTSNVYVSLRADF